MSGHDEREPQGRDVASTAELAGRESGSEPKHADETRDGDERAEPLLPESDAQRFQDQWSEIQGHFVDEPQRAVEEGDALVATLMQRVAETFAEERSRLEQQWDRNEDVSTEELRVALQRYRSFFARLLAA